MKFILKTPGALLLVALIYSSCDSKMKRTPASSEIIGTWKLVSGTLIEKGDTTVTDYTKDRSMIKVVNATHFAFLNHDLRKGKDSAAMFVAGGGRYTLDGKKYSESLEYCSDRQWEGSKFDFEVTLSNDTLIQEGLEKVEEAGVERLNIEKYVRVK